MATLTLTEIVGEPRTWSPKDNPERVFHSYRVKAEDGTVYEINRKATSGPPELGAGEYEITPAKGDFPPKIKKVFQGGGGRGRSPADTAAIQRQHSQEMAIRMLDAFEPRLEGRTAKTYLGLIKELTDWFEADIGSGLGGAGSAGSPAPAASPPAAESSADLATTAQKGAITRLLNQAGLSKDFQRTVVLAVADPLTKSGASRILDILNDETQPLHVRAENLIRVSGAKIPNDAPADLTDLPPVEVA